MFFLGLQLSLKQSFIDSTSVRGIRHVLRARLYGEWSLISKELTFLGDTVHTWLTESGDIAMLWRKFSLLAYKKLWSSDFKEKYWVAWEFYMMCINHAHSLLTMIIHNLAILTYSLPLLTPTSPSTLDQCFSDWCSRGNLGENGHRFPSTFDASSSHRVRLPKQGCPLP